MTGKRFINEKRVFNIGAGTLGEVIEFIEAVLNHVTTNRKNIIRTLLMVEEVLPQIIENSTEDNIKIQVKKFFGDTKINIRSEGNEFDIFAGAASPSDLTKEKTSGSAGDLDDDRDSQRAISALLLKSQEDKLKYYHKRGSNNVQIIMGMSNTTILGATVAALVLGIVCGLLMKTVLPETFSGGMITYLLSPIKTIFMNSLRIIIAPIVFFSIVTCFSQFSNLSEFGRIGAKVMGMYLFTTFVAIITSTALFYLIKPGSLGFALALEGGTSAAIEDAGYDVSIIDTIVNIVPSNFVKPFVESDTLQIIFLAVLSGIALGKIGESASMIKEFFDQCNSLFLTITTIIAGFTPVAVFCSIAIMVRNTDMSTLFHLLGFVFNEALALITMMAVYALLITLIANLNPITFFRKNREGMLTSFTLSSSSAAMPTNMRVCTEELGISPKLANFSIPLGATVNMDGMCTFLVTSSLFLARAYGINVPPATLLSMGLTIVLLSLGAPGVPGAGLICSSVVLRSIGVPTEALGLIIGIIPFIDMAETTSNTTGDVAVSLVVAKTEGLLDVDVYNREMK